MHTNKIRIILNLILEMAGFNGNNLKVRNVIEQICVVLQKLWILFNRIALKSKWNCNLKLAF